MIDILLIDDDEIFQYTMKRVCKKMPQITSFATTNNGLEGLEFIQNKMNNNQKLPDYILLDINMPVMDGFEFLAKYKKLKENNPTNVMSILLAMLTSSAHESDKKRAFESGIVNDYFVKPCNIDDATNMLKNALKIG